MNVLRPTLLTLACLLTQPTMASDLPSLGDASSALVSPQQEYQLGRAWLSIVRGQVSQLSDPQLKDFVESSVYRLADIHRGDVVIFRFPRDTRRQARVVQ